MKKFKEHYPLIIVILSILIIIINSLFDDSSKIKIQREILILALLAENAIIIVLIKEDIQKIKIWINSKVSLKTEIDNILHKIEPDLQKLLANPIDLEKDFLINALENKEIYLKNPKSFIPVYIKVFEIFPKASFIGTSLPYKNYFWSEGEELFNNYQSVEFQIQEFIINGGSITRFFFIDEKYINENNEKDRVIKVLDNQCNLGVNVFVIKKAEEEKEFLFFYSKKNNFGWTADIDKEKRLKEFIFHKNDAKIKSYNEYIENNKYRIRKYKKGDNLNVLINVDLK